MLQEVRRDLFLSPPQVFDRYCPADVVVVHSIGLMVHQEMAFNVGHARDQAVSSVCVSQCVSQRETLFVIARNTEVFTSGLL